MPSTLAWNLHPEESTSGQYEVLFPGEAARFQVYDDEYGIYRILFVTCDDFDAKTEAYNLERTDTVNMGTSCQELDEICLELEPWEEFPGNTGQIIDTFSAPDNAATLIIAHQVSMVLN